MPVVLASAVSLRPACTQRQGVGRHTHRALVHARTAPVVASRHSQGREAAGAAAATIARQQGEVVAAAPETNFNFRVV